MKRLLPFLFLLAFLNGFTQATYYSQGSLPPNLTSSWNTSRTGAGTPPSDFLGNGDAFVIQDGDTMTTSATWQLGANTSKLQIEFGGILIGSNTIQLPNTAFVFQIDDGGTYIHDNSNSVSAVPGASIWSGTEMFGSNSNQEIRNWNTYTPSLPSGISWGNLIINYTVDLGGSWNQAGNLKTIQGDLIINSTGILSQEFRFCATKSVSVTIGGNLIVNGGILNIKSSNPVDSTCFVQVNNNIQVTGGTLNIGMADVVPNTELRFKGNFTANVGAFVISGNNYSYLVANGTSTQTFNCLPLLNCNFRVSPGSTVNQSGSITTGSQKVFAILGTYTNNDVTASITMSGSLEVAGGSFSSTRPLSMGVNLCRSCTGNGSYNSGYEWCTTTGTKGVINFTNNTVTFGETSNAIMHVGTTIASPGDVYLNNAKIRFNAGGSSYGLINVYPGATLSLDATSYISDTAIYNGSGGTLRIGSPDGITASASTGNIRVTGFRQYDAVGINSFEYFGSSTQVTGDGLPTTVDGTLKINNSSGMGTNGVTLTQNTSVSGVLDLSRGKLTTSLSAMLNVARNATAINYSDTSFVYGPMSKTGEETFLFPIGEGAALHTAELIRVAGGDDPTDNFRVQYFKSTPQALHPFTPGDSIDHISALEYWKIDKLNGSPPPVLFKKVSLLATTYSDATDLSKLRIVHFTSGVWKNEGNTASGVGASGPVTSDSVNTFGVSEGIFTFGSIDGYGGNPLPLNLITFNASKINTSKSLVTWELAVCCSSAAKFEVQRGSNERNFTTIGVVGGSETNRLYNFNDNGLQSGINYYRLKMTDADGSVTYSKVVAVLNGAEGLLLTSLAPTIVTGNAILTVTSSSSQRLQIYITDIQGRLVTNQQYNLSPGNNNIGLSLPTLSPGVYHLTGFGETGKTNTLRFIKQ